MLFNSFHFLIFFPIVLIAYFITKHKYRWIILLISSYYFYMSWKAEYVILLIISTLIDYIAGLYIYNSESKIRKKLFLSISMISNLGLLFSFKYFNFFSDSLRKILGYYTIELNPWTLKVLLPVGISFYTFQTMSYTIDVYRGEIKPEKHLGIFALFVSYFPQLVAGPIERAKNLLPQFFEEHHFEFERFADGLRLMLWGFFKKVVIADGLARYINPIYNNPSSFQGIELISATLLFGIQIYCDFSGYCDIAIGSARIMGFKLMENFRRPYYSQSVREFWKRWHISLSTWFKDYLYKSLGGNKVSVKRAYLNVFIVFLLSGLWHGANWTFIVWGILHGSYFLFSMITKDIRDKLNKKMGIDRFPIMHTFIRTTLTFIFVNFAWIFFRSNSISDAFYIVTHLFYNTGQLSLFDASFEIFIAFIWLAHLGAIYIIDKDIGIKESLSECSLIIKLAIYAFELLIIFFAMYLLFVQRDILLALFIPIILTAYYFYVNKKPEIKIFLLEKPFIIRSSIHLSVLLFIISLYQLFTYLTSLPILFISLFSLEYIHLVQEKIGIKNILIDKRVWVRWGIYILILMFILLFGTFEETPFIYFQF